MPRLNLENLNKEKEMIWFDDPRKFEYLREGHYYCNTSRCKPGTAKIKGYLLIGYEKHKINKNISCTRLVYYLKNYDRGMHDAKKGYGSIWCEKHSITPSEAVGFD